MDTKSKVLIVYTGGTIGMINDPITGELSNVDFNFISDHVPEIDRLNIEIDSLSFHQPMDSSEINIESWKEIARIIFENYLNYDGFVVLHGSDTMAYSASALSFMFDGLQKPIILTGSQLPIGIIRTDGKENLITALEIAATKDEFEKSIITEVAVYFDYKLFRGNRCTKDSAENFEAFRSPNFVELATAGVHLEYHTDRLFRSNSDQVTVNFNFNDRIALVKLFPGININHYADVFDKGNVDAVIIETFGAGNSPSGESFKNLLSNFISKGGIVLNVTQCNSGGVEQGLYKSSSMFSELGVISGANMTTEAAITKMMLCIDPNNLAETKRKLTESLRGELD